MPAIKFNPKTEARCRRQIKLKNRPDLEVEVRRRLAVESPELLADAGLRKELEEITALVAKGKADGITREQEEELHAVAKAARQAILERAEMPLPTDSGCIKSRITGLADTRSLEEIDADAAAWVKTVQERREREAANAVKACANCPGFCCLTFSMKETKTEMRKRYRENKAEIASLLARRDRNVTIGLFRYGLAVVDAPAERRLENLYRAQEDCKAVVDMVIPLRITRRLDHARKRSRFYTCRHFLVEEGRCGNYENRPHMCRNFLCGCEKTGKPPKVETMFAHPSNIPVNAEKLKIKWNPLEIPEKPKRKRKWKPSQSVSQEPSECAPCISSASSPSTPK